MKTLYEPSFEHDNCGIGAVVNIDGSISDLKVTKSLSAECDREALRVLRMMPQWKPGIDKGNPCRTMVCVPIVFKM